MHRLQVDHDDDGSGEEGHNDRAVTEVHTCPEGSSAALVGEVDQLEEREGRELQGQKEKLNHQLTELKQFKLLTEDLLQHGIPEEQISLKNA